MRYNSESVTRLVNRLMYGGKKSVAMRVVYQAFAQVEEKMSTPGLQVYEKAMANLRPAVEVNPFRQEGLAMRWLINAARDRSGKSMAEKLAAEVMDAANNTGSAMKKREETHKMAEANRAFAHFRW